MMNQKDPEKEKMCADNYTKTLLFVNTGFFYNEVLNMSRFRAFILSERAKRRMLTGDYPNAAVDSNEALNYDPSLTECYLLKARAESYRKDYYKVRMEVKLNVGYDIL